MTHKTSLRANAKTLARAFGKREVTPKINDGTTPKKEHLLGRVTATRDRFASPFERESRPQWQPPRDFSSQPILPLLPVLMPHLGSQRDAPMLLHVPPHPSSTSRKRGTVPLSACFLRRVRCAPPWARSLLSTLQHLDKQPAKKRPSKA